MEISTRTQIPLDTEGVVIMDRGIVTTVSETTGANLRRRMIKIKDETNSINVTIWNDKVNSLQFS